MGNEQPKYFGPPATDDELLDTSMEDRERRHSGQETFAAAMQYPPSGQDLSLDVVAERAERSARATRVRHTRRPISGRHPAIKHKRVPSGSTPGSSLTPGFQPRRRVGSTSSRAKESGMEVTSDELDAVLNHFASPRLGIYGSSSELDRNRSAAAAAVGGGRGLGSTPMDTRMTPGSTLSQPGVAVLAGIPPQLTPPAVTPTPTLRPRGPGSGSGGPRFLQGECDIDWTTAGGGSWSVRDDMMLTQAVKRQGTEEAEVSATNWTTVANTLATSGASSKGRKKSAKQCEQRWDVAIKPMPVRKGAWTDSEDARLRTLVRELSAKNWSEVAALLSGRTAKQCRERWCYNLDPTISHSLWSPEEDALLIQSQAEMGNKWAQIALNLPGRTENAVKTRFKSILRAKKREWSAEEDATIMRLHATHRGKHWDKIAEELPNRTKNAVKTRYRMLSKGLSAVAPKRGAPNQILVNPTTEAVRHFIKYGAGKPEGSGAHVASSQPPPTGMVFHQQGGGSPHFGVGGGVELSGGAEPPRVKGFGNAATRKKPATHIGSAHRIDQSDEAVVLSV